MHPVDGLPAALLGTEAARSGLLGTEAARTALLGTDPARTGLLGTGTLRSGSLAVVDALWAAFGPFLIPVAVFVIGVVGYLFLVFLGRIDL